MRMRALGAFLLVLLSGSASPASGNEWAGPSARTMRTGRLELGVFSAAKWAPRERLEVAAHPLTLFLAPGGAAKIGWWNNGADHDGGLWLSSRHGLSVPTPFLQLIAKEGTGGLLPVDTKVPFLLMSENDVLFSFGVFSQVDTLSLGVAVANRGDRELPMVEFPFVYSRLAPLYSPMVLRGGMALEGAVVGPLDYQLTTRVSLFRPYVDIPWPGSVTPWVVANETALRLRLRISDRHRVSLGVAGSWARYPIGPWLFWSPTLDYRFALSK